VYPQVCTAVPLYSPFSRQRYLSILYLRALASAGATSSIAQVCHAFSNVLTCQVIIGRLLRASSIAKSCLSLLACSR
jgi:hypothetical protein